MTFREMMVTPDCLASFSTSLEGARTLNARIGPPMAAGEGHVRRRHPADAEVHHLHPDRLRAQSEEGIANRLRGALHVRLDDRAQVAVDRPPSRRRLPPPRPRDRTRPSLAPTPDARSFDLSDRFLRRRFPAFAHGRVRVHELEHAIPRRHPPSRRARASSARSSRAVAMRRARSSVAARARWRPRRRGTPRRPDSSNGSDGPIVFTSHAPRSHQTPPATVRCRDDRIAHAETSAA